MSFYAVVVVFESEVELPNDEDLLIASLASLPVAAASVPWEVAPSNDINANRDAGKWIEGREADDYYPNAGAEFEDFDDVLGQRP